MSYLASSSGPSVSVIYGTAYAGLFYQQGKEINYASLDRAGELVAQMPSSARRTLLAPIEQGLIDPQSVFYLIDDKSENQIAICVEDFVHLASTCFSTESNYDREQSSSFYFSEEGDSPIPPRLLDALLLQAEADEIYSSIDNEISSCDSSHDDQMLSRGDSATSQASISSTLPILPESRPPARSLSCSVGLCIPQQCSEFKELHNSGSISQPSEQFTRTVYSAPIHPKRFSLSSFVEKIGIHIQEYRTRNSQSPACRFRLLIIISAGLTITALAAGIYFLSKITDTKEPLISTTAGPIRGSNGTFDCVHGSIVKVILDGTKNRLIDLKLPEQYPTLTVNSLEYLLVPNLTNWWHAQRYCTGWCGFLVSIRGPDENAKIFGMVKHHSSDMLNYWIGLKAWNNEWYWDDESDVKYVNFPNMAQANKDMLNISNTEMGCIIANSSGLWSMMECDAMFPFVCERNTAENLNRTPFAPHQAQPCQNAGGMCELENDCGADGHLISDLCPDQPKNIHCCIPNTPIPTPPPLSLNSTVKTCADVGGICRHVDADQCRGGRVIFDLPEPCPDRPRPYVCCIENEHFA